jgi:hypothetical protein
MHPQENIDGIQPLAPHLHSSEPTLVTDDISAYRTGLLLPYCSVTPVFQVGGRSTPPEFGDNCIGQAEAVAKKIEVTSVHQPLYLREGRHHAVVWNDGERTLYFDPYLLHRDPIDLNFVQQDSSRKKRFDAYPIIRDSNGAIRMGFLEITFAENGRFFVEKGRFHVPKNEYKVTRFSFDLNQRVSSRSAPNDPEIAFAGEQTTLSLRVFDEASGGLSHLVYPIAKTHPQRIIDETFLYVKTNVGEVLLRGSEQYRQAVHSIATAVGHSTEALESFVMDGVQLYEQHAPREIDYFSRNPANE